MTTAIAISNLTKRYDTVTALSDISLAVESCEIMCFLGPICAVNTTTLRILTGMIAPTSGTVRIEDLDVTERPVEVRRRIGYMPETIALYPELRIQEYLSYRAAIKGVARSNRRTRIDAALAQCDLMDVRR